MRVLRRFLQRLLARMEFGSLILQLPDGSTLTGEGRASGPGALLVLHRWRAVMRLLLEGDLGFAEAYVADDWSTPDLTTLLLLAAQNEAALGAGLEGTILTRLLTRMLHLANANTRRGSRRNIRAHYDLGNDFYAAWLDAGMSYSSALYTSDGMTLANAQTAKQDRVLVELDLLPGQNVLEIGCGWGGLAQRIVRRGACVTGITLSPAQEAAARRRLEAHPDAAEIRLQDYRETTGRYDRIVSVEMFEAVGRAYWPLFFATLDRCLVPGGVAVLQVITIAEDRFATYARRPDFIQAHIFPGGMLPTRRILAEQARAAGFALHEVLAFGQSYARTLAEWATRFERAWPDLRKQGFDEAFRRKWRYYLAYCEAGFLAGALDVGIYRLVRMDNAA